MSSPRRGRTDANKPLRQSSTDQLAAIAHFLDELEVKAPVALLDTINALIAVGAFIAGVQAQMISVIYGSNHNPLGRATNWFGFVGLTLDLIGTSTGVARALLLQHTIRRTHNLAARLTTQINGARHELGELQKRGADLSTDPRSHAFLTHTIRVISRATALLAEDGRFGMQRTENITEIEAAATAALDALGSHSFQKTALFRNPMWWILPHVKVEGLGQVPVASLAGGSLCLLVTVVLFAGASQPHAVWISCTVIAASTLAWSIIPTTNVRSKLMPVVSSFYASEVLITSSVERRRAALFDRVEETLQQYNLLMVISTQAETAHETPPLRRNVHCSANRAISTPGRSPGQQLWLAPRS
ncbi:hypothetical protein B0F90DRAFT_1723572 [Multifurca ochricompacta]|uniref:Uncharacterized protein n=1 Tax=Multifurca ochricompacta TaxID=376703 RepID=A0AAD4M4R3_9AGAM|nr:hypothetical protein B0F90DRAFT_1723572 [Multifurca ochricompacta]